MVLIDITYGNTRYDTTFDKFDNLTKKSFLEKVFNRQFSKDEIDLYSVYKKSKDEQEVRENKYLLKTPTHFQRIDRTYKIYII